MRWKTKSRAIPPKIAVGSKKTFRRFAWWPTKTAEGITVWLEYYLQEYTAYKESYTQCYGNWCTGWRWARIKNRLGVTNKMQAHKDYCVFWNPSGLPQIAPKLAAAKLRQLPEDANGR